LTALVKTLQKFTWSACKAFTGLREDHLCWNLKFMMSQL